MPGHHPRPARAVLHSRGATIEDVAEEIARRAGRGAVLFDGLDRDALAAIGIDLDAVRARIESSFGPEALTQAARREPRPSALKGGASALVLLRRAHPDLFDDALRAVITKAKQRNAAEAGLARMATDRFRCDQADATGLSSGRIARPVRWRWRVIRVDRALIVQNARQTARYERSSLMSRHIQVTFDARDPQALSSFWRDVLGYVHPGPPGVDLPEDADPLAAWDDFLTTIGVPEEQRNTRSALEDPDGHGPRLFFQQVPENKAAKNRVHLDVRAAPGLQGEERMAALKTECDRLVALGATMIRRYEPAPPMSAGFIVMADPEGNEFCLD